MSWEKRQGLRGRKYQIASNTPGFERQHHALQRHDAIAAIDEIRHGLPVERVIGPQADPPPTTEGVTNNCQI